MDAKLFTLVKAGDATQIFAWGMEISSDTGTEAVVYRHDPDTGRSNTGVHGSAESALRIWRRIAPMDLVWEPTPIDVLEEIKRIAAGG
jgi:hypothetical protein